MTGSTYNRKITRILPGLKADYEVVSMSAWAWDWLDENHYLTEDLPAILDCYQVFNAPEQSLSEFLENIVSLLQHCSIQVAYGLVNDNDPFAAELSPVRSHKELSHYPQNRSYAKAVKLFGFMPHAASFDTVIQRRKPTLWAV